MPATWVHPWCVQADHDQWWLRGGAQADDEPSETHTGDSCPAQGIAADHQRLWEGLERDADMSFITVRYQGHLFPHLPSAYMQNGMLY